MVATFVVSNLAQSARVEGRAMAPTLNDQDRVIVNKVAYRVGEPYVEEIVMLYGRVQCRWCPVSNARCF